GSALYGPSIMQQIPDILAGNSPSQINFIKIFQMLSSIGTFILPCYALALIERKRTRYLDFSAPSPGRLLWLSIAVMFVSLPLLQLSIIINMDMQLPDYLSGLEAWMKEKELEMEKLTNLLLSTTTYGGLAINLLMIAVLPGIG